jgi:DNA-binding NtrC family response regulator
LRERREDIRRLAEHFLFQRVQHYRKRVTGFDPAALAALEQHSWPGNVRELQHVVERAVLMSNGETIGPRELGLGTVSGSTPRLDEMNLEEVEAHLIRRTLARFDGNALKAAEALGLSRSAFYRRLEKYKL